MAKKKKKRSFFTSLREGLSDEAKHAVLGTLFFVFSLFFLLAWSGKAGIAGEKIYAVLQSLLGAGYLILPLTLFGVSWSLFRSQTPHVLTLNTLGGLLSIISFLGVLEVFFPTHGGLIGRAVTTPLVSFFEKPATVIFLTALFVIALFIIFNAKPSPLSTLQRLLSRRDHKETKGEDATPVLDDGDEEESHVAIEENEEETEEDINSPTPTPKINSDTAAPPKDKNEEIPIFAPTYEDYVPPPLSLLEKDQGKPSVGDIKANANIIKRTLQNFNIDVEIDEISVGPTFTRFAIKPAEGIRLSRIVALQDDLALALAAHPVRIEAPIPGRSLVGIEIPNAQKTVVGLASLLSSPSYKEKTQPLIASLGRNVSGTPSFIDIARAPHLLIAGATGAGKSVTIHAIITSLLYRNSPATLRFIMTDPKRVELTLYNGIPHQLTPVITDPKKAILSLKWAIKEMERRYNILEAESVRDIGAYHKNVLTPELKKRKSEDAALPELMPYIIIIIDELADIMAVYPKELEAAVIRLAQMSRAVGIHLILSTQRPSVNVITGLIKANISSRIALQVASQIDSRTILDMAGAERLLGAGDMLYISAEMSKPMRLQAPFISEKEVKKVVSHLKKQTIPVEEELDLESAEEKNNLLNGNNGEGDDDELYEEARELVINTRKASTSFLQRKLGLGYARAARLMDMLEERGVVGPQQGARPREVIAPPSENNYDENV